MLKRSRQLLSSFFAAMVLPLLFLASAHAADTGPLDAGTRLLVNEQPILHLVQDGRLSIHACEADEDMVFSGSRIDEGMSGEDFDFMGHAAVMGGCVTTDEEGKVKDDRFLLSIGTYTYGLRLLRIDPRRGGESPTKYSVSSFGARYPHSLSPFSDPAVNFLDVAASDWNGDGYTDFAVLYPTYDYEYGEKHPYVYRYVLVLVNGRPDENGKFTCHQSHGWQWTLQSADTTHDLGFSQGRIGAGDVDNDGRNEIVIHIGNMHLDGDDDRNLLAVYDITEDLQLGDGVTANAGESCKDWDALDVAVGDFRGTGHGQIATLSTNKCEISARVWEVQNGSLKKVADLGNVGELPENKDSNGYLRCVAGDLNGDGRDELVWAGCDRHTDSGKIAVVVHTNLNEDGGLNLFKSGTRYPLESDAGKPIFDLALGYFSEGFIPSDTTYPNRMQIALAVRRHDGGYDADMVEYGLLSWDGSDFTEGEPSEMLFDWRDEAEYPVIVAGDLTKESLSLGDPLHYEVVQQLSPVVVMQGTPRHWDRIGSNDYDAFSAFSGYKTAFSLQNSSTESAESSSQASVSSTVKGAGSAEFKFLSLADTKLQASFAQSRKDLENDLSRYTQTRTMKLTAEAATDDWLYYTFQNLEIWRYPVLGQAGEAVADDVSTEDVYYQVVYPSSYTTKMSGGRDKEWYSPVHENLNLLSYPADVEYISDYPEPGSDRILFGGPDSKVAVTVGADVSGTQSNSFNSASFEQEKESHSVTNTFDGSLGISGKLFGIKAGLTVSGKYDDAFTETSTNSVNLSNALGFTTAIPAGSGYLFKDGRTARSARFDLYETAFLSDGKETLVAGYAVDLLGPDSGALWTDDGISPYRELADPALNLPQKWELQTVPGTYAGTKTQWALCESETTRKKLRGGFAIQPDEEGGYGDSTPQLLLTLDNSGTVRLRCRVHNYSFVECGPVDVKFSYSHPGAGESGLPTEGTLVGIGTVTLNGIRAWTRTGMPNREMVEVDWDTSSLEEGSYWIHVEIDPGDKIVEIHDTGDEAGNNEGWFQVGLVKESTLDRLAEKYLDGEDVRNSGVIDASGADLEDVSFTMDNPDAGEGETTLLRGVVANSGDRPMALVHVDFFERSGGEWNLFDEEIIPVLMPGRTRVLEVPFTPSSSASDVKMVIDPSLGEADFANNSMEITRSSGSGGCSVAPFPVLLLALPLLGVLKR